MSKREWMRAKMRERGETKREKRGSLILGHKKEKKKRAKGFVWALITLYIYIYRERERERIILK